MPSYLPMPTIWSFGESWKRSLGLILVPAGIAWTGGDKVFLVLLIAVCCSECTCFAHCFFILLQQNVVEANHGHSTRSQRISGRKRITSRRRQSPILHTKTELFHTFGLILSTKYSTTSHRPTGTGVVGSAGGPPLGLDLDRPPPPSPNAEDAGSPPLD